MKIESHRISDMTRSDLLNIANELPYTGQDHYKKLLYHFKRGGHEAKNEYIDQVFLFVKEVHTQNKPLGAIIFQKWADCMDNILSFAVGAKKWLNR